MNRRGNSVPCTNCLGLPLTQGASCYGGTPSGALFTASHQDWHWRACRWGRKVGEELLHPCWLPSASLFCAVEHPSTSENLASRNFFAHSISIHPFICPPSYLFTQQRFPGHLLCAGQAQSSELWVIFMGKTDLTSDLMEFKAWSERRQ